MNTYPTYDRQLPKALQGLNDLACDLRWSCGLGASRLWPQLDPDLWMRKCDPVEMLQNLTDERAEQLAVDTQFLAGLQAVLQAREDSRKAPDEFKAKHPNSPLTSVAYFSMEFGLSESLPIYAGGLGILAGDHLKSASDLGVPITAIGLLYDQGYFEQTLSPDGWQIEAYPFNDPSSLPIAPLYRREGGWLRVPVELPGRTLMLRVWQVQVGNVTLYLLDSNDLTNSSWDRALTDRLYTGPSEKRLLQELILGFGGWRLIEALGIDPEVCHLNEGHAAFVVVARAQAFMQRCKTDFDTALRATRAGNLFTTHTPVPAGFDRFDPNLPRRYLKPLAKDVSVDAILGLGRESESDATFNMAFLASRGSGAINGVSRLHGAVSRGILAPLFPRWPLAEIPVGYVTNAIHIDSWSGSQVPELWKNSGAAWELIADDDLLLQKRNEARRQLVAYVRNRLARQRGLTGASVDESSNIGETLDENALTLGFARRFAPYKRADLLLSDVERLKRLLNSSDRPVQLIVAGKAHPGDDSGKRLVQLVVQASQRADLAHRLVYLADYDMALTKHLAAGVDVWINTPRRPMEASGTSGMKLLVNGGLNLSELDGWWAEAYSPEIGWALGDGEEHAGENIDGIEAAQLYAILEEQVVPEFYSREDGSGIPRTWLRRVRASMTKLTPEFNAHRMVSQYLEAYYIPAAGRYRERSKDGGQAARDLQEWNSRLSRGWGRIRIGETSDDGNGAVSATVYLGEIEPGDVRVELFADAVSPDPIGKIEMVPDDASDGGAYCYRGRIDGGRPLRDYTIRVVGTNPEAVVLLESGFIVWQR